MEIIIIAVVILIAAVYLLIMRSQQRYSEPGSKQDSRNVVEYGAPVKRLYTSSKVFTLHHRIEVTDENENVVYRAETKFPSIHDKTDIFDANGRHVAYFERKLITLHEIHYVDMENGRSFVLSNEIMHIIKDVTNIEGLGWRLDGNILQLNFTLADENGELIAVVSQKLISLHDKYSVDIYKPEYEEEVVAILITLQHMVNDREVASSVGSSGGSSSGSN
jgi:uncharacterized protein YxjI